MRWWPSRASAAAALVPPLVLGWLGWRHRWTSEDAFILLRVVQNLLDGHGPVWNLDERVEAYTSPLWVGLLTLGGLALGPPRLEWTAVVLGLVGSVAGLLAAGRGALRLARARGAARVALPLGGLVVAALPPYWDYATSGLESGLVFAWLGGSFWLLARRATAPAGDIPRGDAWVAVAIGLGPLVRPDLGLVTAGFLLVLLWAGGRGAARWLGLILATAALPLAYQVFRMGYFAALVPNTALAKAAFDVHWGQGWRYLWDLVGTYWLWAPCLALALALPRGGRAGDGRRGARLLVLVPVACGLLHALYVVRLGGDFMHARMLLPSLFAVLLPVSVVGVRSAREGLAAAVVLPWALACALWLRVPYGAGMGPAGIADERGVHAASVGRPHPVTLEDYASAYVARDGQALRELAGRRRAVLLGGEIVDGRPWPPELTPASWVKANVVAGRPNIGILGYTAGPAVHVVDRLGLADPLGARLRIAERGRPGHEKWLSDAWIAARFADPGAALPPGAPPEAAVTAARAALACGPIREVLDAIEGPLTWARLAVNIGVAWRSRRLAIPADPAAAASGLCGPGGRR